MSLLWTVHSVSNYERLADTIGLWSTGTPARWHPPFSGTADRYDKGMAWGRCWLLGYGWLRRGWRWPFVGMYWGRRWPTQASQQSNFFFKKEKHKFKLGVSRNAYCFSAVDFTSSLLSFTLSNHHHHPIADLPCAGGGRGSEVRLWARRVGVRQRHEPILAGEPCSRRLCGEDIWHARAGEPHTRSWWSAGWHGGNIARPNHQLGLGLLSLSLSLSLYLGSKWPSILRNWQLSKWQSLKWIIRESSIDMI